MQAKVSQPQTSLFQLLKGVSRSFYLTLRILPNSVRPQIGLAYLLARAADTIADTEIIPAAERLRVLQKFRERLLGSLDEPFQIREFVTHQGSQSERLLLDRIEEAFVCLDQFDEKDRTFVREVLQIITGGQELDLQRFAYASASCVIALRTDAELDDYTYRVAGCVGEFWTRMCRRHVFPLAELDDEQLLVDGARFGKGLQLVNILRDLPADLRRGRCYLPLEKLAELDLSPQDLLSPANENRARPLYDEYLARTESHLSAGWNYTNRLPRSSARIRLACAWPILIGKRTVDKLRSEKILASPRPIKIRRGEVRKIVFQSVLAHPFPSVWTRLFRSGRT